MLCCVCPGTSFSVSGVSALGEGWTGDALCAALRESWRRVECSPGRQLTALEYFEWLVAVLEWGCDGRREWMVTSSVCVLGVSIDVHAR